MTAVVLGVDVGTKSLGLALVEFEPPHRPVWADVVSIDRPDGGWAHQQVAEALGVARGCAVYREKRPPGDMTFTTDGFLTYQSEITRVVIEDPPFVKANPRTLKQLTAVAALVQAEALRRWPWAAPVIWQTPGEWKKATVGKGNATKADVLQWSEETYMWVRARMNYGPMPKQDAIDAIAIAVAGAKVELGEREAA